MIRHAKAPSSGSSTRQGSRLGAFIRGALATREAPSRANGSGAPRARLVVAASSVLALSLVLGVAIASALAPTVTFEHANASYTTATFSGTVDTVGEPFTYRFEYATQPDFSDALIAAQGARGANEDNSAQQIEDHVAGLQPHTTYYLRLIAENDEGQDEAEAPSSIETLEPAAPIVDRTYVSGVGSTEATLNAKVDPAGAATTYRFEYVDQAGYEASEFTGATATAEQPLSGPANPFNVASVGLSGLEAGTTYYYRVLAANSKGDIEGPAKRFHTYASADEAPDACPNAARRAEQQATELPDCRAWELVSPPDKNGGDVVADILLTQAAPDGSAVVFRSLVGFGDVRGTGVDVQYLAERGGAANGWSAHAITPQTKSYPGFNISPTGFVGFFTDDLSEGLFRAYPALPNFSTSNSKLVANLYRLGGLRGGGEETELLTDAFAPLSYPPGFTEELVSVGFGAWPVGASTDLSHVVFESRARLTANASPGFSPKLYEYSGGEVRLAGILPDESAASSSQGGRGFGGAAGSHYAPTHPISEDGSRVFFKVPSGEGEGNLYMREDATSTVQLDASERTTPEEPQPAELWAASADGSRAFFTTNESLLDSDESFGTDAYMWQAEANEQGHHLTRISAGTNGDGITSILGASDDGHYVYLMSSGGRIYVWHDGTVEDIGGLVDFTDTLVNYGDRFSFAEEYRTARVSPDGHHLLFVSRGDENLVGHGGFSGYDQQGHNELYLYDAVDKRLQCASCDPSGTPASAGVLGRPGTAGPKTAYLNNSLSDDGRRVFFSTADPLVPEDTNGQVDAYEFDSESGEVHLLSSGTSSDHSYFANATPDGETAFIVTRERLVGWDFDDSRDLYAVGVGGGLPEPGQVTAPCEGETCRPATPPTPAPAALGSTQEGPRNRGARKPCSAKKKAAKHRCHKHKSKKRNAKNNRRAGK